MDRIDKAIYVINSSISGVKISRNVSVSEATISRYRNKKFELGSLRLEHVIELSKFYENNLDKNI